jgi:Peptidase family M28/PDZ domain/PA domain
MRHRLVRPAVLACLLLFGARLSAAETLSDLHSPAASEARLKKDITYLASDELEGRGVSTRGINLAADFIAAEFKKAGLKPGGKDGTYFQPFTMPGAVLLKPATLKLRGPAGQEIELKSGEHFQPMGVSTSGVVNDADVVFVGYGITSKDPDIDEYAGLDVAGKVVVILRDTFRADDKSGINQNWRRKYGSMTEKMGSAVAHKAAAILFVNDRDTASTGDDLLNFAYHAGYGGSLLRLPEIPALHVRRSVIEKILGKKLEDLERDIDRDQKPRSRAAEGWTASLSIEVKRAKDALKLRNVVGVLEGSGDLKDETVVLGAHYDHVGFGGASSLSSSKKMEIHHGADDNGSGTTSILELARRFGAIPKREGRRLVFMTFSGEESGLLGSEAYCKEPIFPLDKTASMINLDMVGRMVKDKDSGKERLTVYGTGTAKTFDGLIESLNKKYDFQIKKVATGLGPSDQMTFYEKKVPVFFFFTNDHPDYHRPTDTSDKINVPGMRRIVDLTEELAANLATAPRPEYVKVAGPSMTPGMSGPRLGIKPDYGDDKEGVLLSGVADGEAASKAGLKAGDRIVEIAGQPVKSLEGYMVVMRGQKPGSTIDVSVLRDKEKKVFKVKLD